jgi:hypothetical protein
MLARRGIAFAAAKSLMTRTVGPSNFQIKTMARGAASRVLGRIAIVIFLVAAYPFRAAATLGQDATSVNADRVKMQGALLNITQNDRFTVHQLQSATGTTIREYVSTTGMVLAVSWDGPWLPDLQQMLGPYFDAYQRNAAAVRNARRSHGPITIRTGEMVIQVGGHPRAFTGRAYIERMLPQGVPAAAIR